MFVREGFQELHLLVHISPFKDGERTYNLQLILPKLLLARLVEKREIAHMVNKNIPQNRQFRINGRNLAEFRLKWRTKAMQGSW